MIIDPLLPHHEQRASLWLSKSSWPSGNSSYLFLPIAIDEVGKTLFPEEWKGCLDIAAYHTPTLPFIWRAQPRDHDNALNALRNYQEDLEIPKTQRKITSNIEWEAAAEIIEGLNEEARPGIARYDEVIKAMVSAIQDDRITIALRPVSGGQFTEAPSWWWNTEILGPRLAQCQMNALDPFGSEVAGKNHSYIFVTRSSLFALCDRLRSGAPVKQTANAELRCQIWLEAQFMKQETKSWRKTRFRELAMSEEFGPALSGNAFDRAWSLATAKPEHLDRRQAGVKSSR